ncbi:NUDIX hydrolase [Halovenus rubra]|uniref:NUDIX hydrolase n=2 Tax=Halovenus rubra TaxID=869890 RepID=A0ABD5XBI0_9EURY|nr:NUDIX hydrolase [Halovenus rubra]
MDDTHSITARSKTRVDNILADLEQQYGSFEVVKKRWERSEVAFDRLLTQFEQGRLDGAGVWITNDDGEVLLVRNEGEDGWADPGGKVEVGEEYATAAKREVREETGIDCTLTGLRELHKIENITASHPASIFEVIAVFDGEYVDGAVRAKDGEIADIGWFSVPPSTVLYEEVRQRPYPAQT